MGVDQRHYRLTCDYCGAICKGIHFAIGASTEPEWTMVEGTGQMTCPDCYPQAVAEGRAALRKHTGLR